MRRGRGGGGGLLFFYYTRCAESCCFTSPPPPSSAVLFSPNPKVSSRIFKVPTFLPFFDRSNHFCGRHLAGNTTSRRLGENFKPPPAAAAQGTRIQQGYPNTSPFATSIWLVWKLTLTSAKLDRPHLHGVMTRRSCAIYATGIVCAHLLIVGIALLVAQVFQTMIHSRLKQVSHGPSQS